jgi:hypothetical protein
MKKSVSPKLSLHTPLSAASVAELTAPTAVRIGVVKPARRTGTIR